VSRRTPGRIGNTIADTGEKEASWKSRTTYPSPMKVSGRLLVSRLQRETLKNVERIGGGGTCTTILKIGEAAVRSVSAFYT